MTTGSKALVSLFPMPDSSTPCKARVGELHVRVSTCVPRFQFFGRNKNGSGAHKDTAKALYDISCLNRDNLLPNGKKLCCDFPLNESFNSLVAPSVGGEQTSVALAARRGPVAGNLESNKSERKCSEGRGWHLCHGGHHPNVPMSEQGASKKRIVTR